MFSIISFFFFNYIFVSLHNRKVQSYKKRKLNKRVVILLNINTWNKHYAFLLSINIELSTRLTGYKKKFIYFVMIKCHFKLTQSTINQVWCVPVGGMVVRQPVSIGGSGSTYLYGLMDHK